MRVSRWALLLTSGALMVIAFLFVRGRPWDTTEHDRYRTQLRLLRVGSGQLERQLLTSLLDQEPPGTEALRAELRRLRQALGDFPRFVPDEGQARLRALLEEHDQALSQTERQYELGIAAKERLATGLPSLTAQLRQLEQRLPGGDAAAREHLEALSEELMRYTMAPSAEGERRIREHLQALPPGRGEEGAALHGKLRSQVEDVLVHWHALDGATTALENEPMGRVVDELFAEYLGMYERANWRAEAFRLSLVGISVLLVLYILHVLVRLARAGEELTALNSQLNERVEDRTRALTASVAELRESQARKAAIFEAAPDGIFLFEAAGRILEVNPAAERTLGLARSELLGKRFFEQVLPGQSREALQRRIRACAEQGECWTHELRLELTAQRADGRLFPAELAVTRVHGEGPPHFTAYVRDITERKQVERMKNEFVSTVSHELRTPLTSIRGSLGLLEGGIMGELSAPVLDLVRIARTNTERLIRLINDILDLEKMEAGKLELRPQPVEVAEVVEATFASLSAMADAAKVRLRSEMEGVGQVLADRDRLIQVLTNLVSNAIKFSPEGGVVTVWAAWDEHGRVRFRVVDQGPGIAVEHHSRLFGKFEQLDSSDTRTKGGTGLGLAITQAIMQQHGSRVEVHSEPGRGAVFSFVLPSVDETRQTEEESPVAEPPRPGS